MRLLRTCGPDGCLVAGWWDAKAERPRVAVAYVGEGGIKPDTWYRVSARGKFVRVKAGGVMRALTLTQPWATLVAIGAKRVETRSWSTAYRGPVAMHAAKAFPQECIDLCHDEPFRSVLKAAGVTCAGDLPRAAVIAVADLTACHRFAPAGTLGLFDEAEHEQDFGDWTAGRFGFQLADAQRIEPVPCRGALGLWTLPDDVEAGVREQLVGAAAGGDRG